MTTYNRTIFTKTYSTGQQQQGMEDSLAELGSLPANYQHYYTNWQGNTCTIGIDVDDTLADVAAVTAWKNGLSLTDVSYVEIQENVEHLEAATPE